MSQTLTSKTYCYSMSVVSPYIHPRRHLDARRDSLDLMNDLISYSTYTQCHICRLSKGRMQWSLERTFHNIILQVSCGYRLADLTY